MVKIIGMKPDAETQKRIGKFEDEVMIRHNNQQLVGTVYVDMQENRWTVAFAYNYTRKPGLHGHENLLEVRYCMVPHELAEIRLFRSDAGAEQVIATENLPDKDTFIRYVLGKDRIARVPAAQPGDCAVADQDAGALILWMK